MIGRQRRVVVSIAASPGGSGALVSEVTTSSGARLRRAILLLIVAALVLAACAGDDPTNLGRVVGGDVPQNSLNPGGPIAEKVDSLFWMVFWIAVAVFVLVSIVLLFAILRFRERKGKERQVRQLHGNTKLEIAWTIIPVVILAVIAVPTLSTLFEIRSAHPEDNASRSR
jgi:cytochrome c oxidase subunit 2